MKKIKIRPYSGVLYFTTCRKEFLKMRLRFSEPFEKRMLENCSGIASDNGQHTHVVGVFDGKLSTLVHELNHVVIKEMASVGIQIDVNNQEPACYLLEDLFTRCQVEMN